MLTAHFRSLSCWCSPFYIHTCIHSYIHKTIHVQTKKKIFVSAHFIYVDSVIQERCAIFRRADATNCCVLPLVFEVRHRSVCSKISVGICVDYCAPFGAVVEDYAIKYWACIVCMYVCMYVISTRHLKPSLKTIQLNTGPAFVCVCMYVCIYVYMLMCMHVYACVRVCGEVRWLCVYMYVSVYMLYSCVYVLVYIFVGQLE